MHIVRFISRDGIAGVLAEAEDAVAVEAEDIRVALRLRVRAGDWNFAVAVLVFDYFEFKAAG